MRCADKFPPLPALNRERAIFRVPATDSNAKIEIIKLVCVRFKGKESRKQWEDSVQLQLTVQRVQFEIELVIIL